VRRNSFSYLSPTASSISLVYTNRALFAVVFKNLGLDDRITGQIPRKPQ